MKSKYRTLSIIKFGIIYLIFFCANLQAETLSEYIAEDESFRKDPWGSYQSILQKENQIDASPQKQFLFLLRKAQAEHLLNDVFAFTLTVKELENSITTSMPVELKCRLNILIGIAARIDAKYRKSEKYLNIALKQAKKGGLHHLTVFAKLELAYTHSLFDFYDTSLKNLQEAYVAAYSLDDDYLIALINEAYGAIYGYMHDYPKAIEYYKKAKSEYEQLGYPAHINNALYGIAMSFKYWKKYDEAVPYFERYIANSLYSLGMPPPFYGLYGLAVTQAKKGDCKNALITANKALALNGIADYDAELYKSKAQCFIKLDRLEEAESALNSAKIIFDTLPEVKGTAWHVEVFKIESELAFAQNNKDKAYRLIKTYYDKAHILLENNYSKKLVQFKEINEKEQQNSELIFLQQRDKNKYLLQDKNNQYNKQVAYFVVFGLCLLVIGVFTITVKRNYNNKLITSSITDSLTGLYNRHYTFDYLTNVIEKAAPDEQFVSIIIIDVDKFKYVNEKHGYPFGDHVIKTIADLIQQALNTGDMIGRIEGDVFLCVLPRITKNQSTEIAQRINQQINKYSFLHSEGKSVDVTVSIGIANAITDHCSAYSLYVQAEQALNESKRLGVNKITMYFDNKNTIDKTQ